jgi:hypothetical protein
MPWNQASGFPVSTFPAYGRRPTPSLRRYNHPFSQSVLLEVMAHSGYSSLRVSRSARPPARTARRVPLSPVARV